MGGADVAPCTCEPAELVHPGWRRTRCQSCLDAEAREWDLLVADAGFWAREAAPAVSRRPVRRRR